MTLKSGKNLIFDVFWTVFDPPHIVTRRDTASFLTDYNELYNKDYGIEIKFNLAQLGVQILKNQYFDELLRNNDVTGSFW